MRTSKSSISGETIVSGLESIIASTSQKKVYRDSSSIVLQLSGVSGDGPKLEVPHLTPYIKMFV